MVVCTKLYERLEITDYSCDENEIKKAYKKLARVHHPDKGGSEEKFKEINEAYKILTDSNLRELYDKTGNVKPVDNAGAPPADFDILSELFGNFGFSGPGFSTASSGRQRTPDMVHEIVLPLESLYTGKKKTIVVKRKVICKKCKGKGGSNPDKCKTCNGVGMIMMQQFNGMFVMQSNRECHSCKGTGRFFTVDNACSLCETVGLVLEKSTIELNIPPGAPNGYTIVLKNMADEKAGVETGNLHIIIKEKAHETFTRQGLDLRCIVNIDLATALVGGTIRFTGLDKNEVSVYLPKGKVIKAGDTIVLSNKGMPAMHSPTQFGDMRIMFAIDMPSDNWAQNISETVVRKIFAA